MIEESIEKFKLFILQNHKLRNHNVSESLWHISLVNHGVEYAEQETFESYDEAKKVFDYFISNPVRNGKFQSVTEMIDVDNPKTVAIWQTIEDYKQYD